MGDLIYSEDIGTPPPHDIEFTPDTEFYLHFDESLISYTFSSREIGIPPEGIDPPLFEWSQKVRYRRWWFKEDLLDSTGLNRIDSTYLLLGRVLAHGGWAGWSVEEVNLSGTMPKDEAHCSHELVTPVLPPSFPSKLQPSPLFSSYQLMAELHSLITQSWRKRWGRGEEFNCYSDVMRTRQFEGLTTRATPGTSAVEPESQSGIS